MKKDFKKFFEDNPDIQAIKWVQYTPYFNDGDPCEFRVGDFSFCNTDDKEVLSDVWYDWYNGDGEDPIISNNRTDAFESSYLSSAAEDVMLATFGDHAEIIATIDGFQVEHYDHD